MELFAKNGVTIQNLKAHEGKNVQLNAWVMNKRSSKKLVFLVLRDGTGFCQCVVNVDDVGETVFEQAKRIPLESSVCVGGAIIKDERQVGGYELQASSFQIYAEAEDYPIGKKEHGVDFLLDNRHLWLRSRKQWAIMRIRNKVIFSLHQFFQQREFLQMDAPIFTGNACEGTTELFETDYFDTKAYLSQSGQLYGEAMAMAMGKIYTFGPTFRAEKSKTRRHLTEFIMIEPEMAFYDLAMTMDLIEDMIKEVVQKVLADCQQELEILERDLKPLENVSKAFPKITYDEACEILKGAKSINGKTAPGLLEEDLAHHQAELSETKAKITEYEGILNKGGLKKGKINYYTEQVRRMKVRAKVLETKIGNIPQWLKSAKEFEYGNDFGGSDETVITRLFDTPVMVYNWPKAIKAFYMKTCEDRADQVKGVDVLAPEGYGEIIGGAERETDKSLLIESIKKHELPMDAFEWYLDLRRFGSVPHAGFGLGLERFVSWICHLEHLRESIPFPRTMGRLLP